MTREEIEGLWQSRDYSCDLWRDPPGEQWEDFCHDSDELIYLLEGDVELELEGARLHLKSGDEAFIPAHSLYSIRNRGESSALWLFGHRTNA